MFAHSARPRRRPVKQTAENGAPAETGTTAAIKDYILSPAITGARPFTKVERNSEATAAEPIRKIGQNRRGRRSTALRESDARNIIEGAQFAAEIGLPLNRHLTIHFVAAGIADPVRAIGRYLKLALDWLATQGSPFAYIWVREAGERKGEHVHILMHVPPHLVRQFARRERGWRKRIGAKRALGAFHSTSVGRTYRHAEAGIQYGQSYSDHLREIVGYLVKGAEPRAVKALGLTRVERGGELWGKRTGMSENIGRAARKRAPLSGGGGWSF